MTDKIEENTTKKNDSVSKSELSDLLASATNNKELLTCNGIIFKASVQHFYGNKGSLNFRVCLSPVKRKSCPGCKKCGWQSDSLCEVSDDWTIHGIEKCENGKFYSIKTCNESRDVETGKVDAWDLCLIDFIEG